MGLFLNFKNSTPKVLGIVNPTVVVVISLPKMRANLRSNLFLVTEETLTPDTIPIAPCYSISPASHCAMVDVKSMTTKDVHAFTHDSLLIESLSTAEPKMPFCAQMSGSLWDSALGGL